MPSAPVYIRNIEAFLPGEPVDNDHIEAVLGMLGDKPSRAKKIILRSNGIQTRHYAIDPVTRKATHTNAQLTAEAVRKLHGKAGCDLNQLEVLSCGTSAADVIMPGHGVMVHGELGGVPCEVNSSAGICLSGIMALKYAYAAVAAGICTHAVATGSETASAMLNANNYHEEVAHRVDELHEKPEIAFEKDFLRWMLSDGAGAMYLSDTPNPEGLSLRIDWMETRSYANQMPVCMYAGCDKREDGSAKGWKEYTQKEWTERSVFAVKQDVKLLNENIVFYSMIKPMTEIKEKRGLKASEIDYFLPHYSSHFFREKNYEALKEVGLEIPYEKWFTNLPYKGNTGSASIYIILEELLKSGRLKKGDRLLCFVPESGRFSTGFMHLSVV